jgi:hypothetical protein
MICFCVSRDGQASPASVPSHVCCHLQPTEHRAWRVFWISEAFSQIALSILTTIRYDIFSYLPIWLADSAGRAAGTAVPLCNA